MPGPKSAPILDALRKACDRAAANGKTVGRETRKALAQILSVPTGLLTGDIWDADAFNTFGDMPRGTSAVLISICGVANTLEDGKKMTRSIKAFGKIPFATMVNGAHPLFNEKLPVGDLLQSGLYEADVPDQVAIRAAKQIDLAAQALRSSGSKSPRIYVVAHSQGTAAFKQACQLLDDQTRAMIFFYGNGGRDFIDRDSQGLAGAWNFRTQDDIVPKLIALPNGFLRNAITGASNGDVIVIGPGAGKGIAAAHSWTGNYQKLYSTADCILLPRGSHVAK
jgi:hypothetical protein